MTCKCGGFTVTLDSTVLISNRQFFAFLPANWCIKLDRKVNVLRQWWRYIGITILCEEKWNKYLLSAGGKYTLLEHYDVFLCFTSSSLPHIYSFQWHTRCVVANLENPTRIKKLNYLIPFDLITWFSAYITPERFDTSFKQKSYYNIPCFSLPLHPLKKLIDFCFNYSNSYAFEEYKCAKKSNIFSQV